MIYVFDTNSFKVCENYYPSVFPTFWENLNKLVTDGRLVSVSEVRKELDNLAQQDHLITWIDENAAIFSPPTSAEMERVSEILAIPHFQQLIGKRQILEGSPVADPFIIARGIELDACVVTEEMGRPHAAKIPNVCDHFGVKCLRIQEVLVQEGWTY